MSEKPIKTTQETAPAPFSEAARAAEQVFQRPTAENPILFGVEDAITMVSFEQVPGESLRGIVDGYFYTPDGQKVNIITLNDASAALAGFESGKTMKVPESAIRKPEASAEIATPPKLSHEQEEIADIALETAAHITSPDESEGIDALRITADELKAYRQGKAHPQTITQQEPVSQVPETAVSPEKSESNTLKQEMADVVDGLSDMDKFYVEQYAAAGPNQYDRQAVLTTKMSKDVLRSDILTRYQILYDKKQKLTGLSV